MSGKRNVTWKDLSLEFVVGCFFFAALLILAWFTIVLSRESLFQPEYRIEVSFPRVPLLAEGDKVAVRGVPVGRVGGVELADGSVTVAMALTESFTVYEDYRVQVLNSSMLGGHYIAIDPGGHTPGAAAVPRETTLEGLPPADLVNDAAEMVRTLKDELERVAAAFEDSQLIPKMADLVDRADRVMDGVEQGKGTVGRLLADDSLFEQAVEMTAALQSAGERLGAAGDRVSRLVDEASTGNGMIARLLQDDSLYDRALGLIKDLESGQGTLGQLIQNPEVYDEIRAAAGNLSAFSERLNDPDSSVSRLLSDNGRLYSRIEGALGALDEIGKEAKEGDGTIGRLLRDPALYEEARQTLDGVRKAVEDFREQAPISTFGSLFFGAL